LAELFKLGQNHAQAEDWAKAGRLFKECGD